MRRSTRFVLAIVVAFALSTVAASSLLPVHASAATPAGIVASVTSDPGGGSPAAASDCGKSKLLGVFVPWYQYLKVGKDDTGSCAVKDFNLLPKNGESSDIPLVLLAIVDDLLRLAGLVAVIFVIYGGIQYATSQGSPDATSKAQSTILNALIGLAIAMVAVAFVSFLGRALT